MQISLSVSIRLSFCCISSRILKAMLADETRRTELAKSMLEEYGKTIFRRRENFNKIQELKGNIRVYCRVRPPAAGALMAVTFPSTGELVVTNESKKRTDSFEFEVTRTPLPPSLTPPYFFAHALGFFPQFLPYFPVYSPSNPPYHRKSFSRAPRKKTCSMKWKNSSPRCLMATTCAYSLTDRPAV